MSCWTMSLSGCATRVVAISDNKLVDRMKAGVPYTPDGNGWFVPDARFREMLMELHDCK